MKTLIAIVASLAILAPYGTASAATATASDPHAILLKIQERNPSLRSFTSRVHVDIRMLNFPFFSPKLDGTSYFKRPNNYEVVFDKVPSYAKGLNRFFADVGDPLEWERDWNISVEGRENLNGRPMLVLRMTKKIHSTITDHALAYIDPENYQVARMDWVYTNGGHITMAQTYRTDGPYTVISSQHATIQIPHIRAVADATYGLYQANVAVNDSVFTGKR
ncbi:MAG: hypothetical protein M3Y21_08840 [Candidatus Eremiobacteraeota bacterium]|nr:hypothetical protein [Candidatus Eremiobacteraeota bacterium]